MSEHIQLNEQPRSQPHRPVDPSALRARRTLAAARAARDGITNMVDALRLSKPPRAPLSTPTSSRHALIPLAEGREELEARIRALENTVAARDEALTRLKRQWGRALVRRRHAERERDIARSDLASLANDVALAARGSHPTTALDDVAAAVDIARTKMTKPSGKLNTQERENNENDNHSIASYASSQHTPEDRAQQIATLTELVDILESRITASTSGGLVIDGKPMAVVARARKTLNNGKLETTPQSMDIEDDENNVNMAREKVEKEIGKDTSDLSREEKAVTAAARAQAQLVTAQNAIKDMSERLVTMEKLIDKGTKYDEVLARNRSLETEMQTTKRMMGRLVQERNSLKKNVGSARSHKSSVSRTHMMGDSDAMRRVLDWRQRASSETNSINGKPSSTMANGNGYLNEVQQRLDGGIDRSNQLPDRVTDDPLLSSPTKRRRMGFDGRVFPLHDSNSISERSNDGVLDSASAQSLPVRGFLRRHDSFLSSGEISASGDEITLMNHRNIFKTTNTTSKADGLRGLLFE